MRRPVAFAVTCPTCGRRVNVDLQDAGTFMLTDSAWRCPHCKRANGRAEFEDKEAAPKGEAG